MHAPLTKIASTLLLALSLASCATMSPEQCKNSNWHDVGMRDGMEGAPLSMLTDRANDCAEAKVVVDNTAYLRGRDVGLKSYCRVDNATQLGLNGGTYHGVCPPQIDPQFRSRFTIGHNVFVARNEVGRIERSMQTLEKRLHTIDRDEDKHVRDARTENDRRRVRRDADDARHRTRNELRDLDYSLRRARDQLHIAESMLGSVR